MSNVDDALQVAFSVLRPPPELTVSQWADAHRYLSPEDSAEPGRWDTARAEYQRGIMDAFSDPKVLKVVAMTSAQVGKTSVINNVIGFHIDQDPAPILLVQPTLEMGEAWSKDRFVPMLRDTPRLRGKVRDARSRDSGNTLLHKVFPGGHITIAGSNSAASLASRPIRIVLCDEVDRYPSSAGTEGDPIRLAEKRATTFWNRKIGLTSTPTITGISRIENAFEGSDKRRFFVPCPDCGEYQFLRWAQVIWREDHPETAEYSCEHCGCLWDDIKRNRAVSRGEWRATAEFNGIAGFHLNEIYSPWVKLSEMATSFLEAKRGGREQFKTWVNTSLGESFLEQGDAPDWKRLYDRREDYKPGIVQRGGLFLTAGADVQKDRIEIEVVAWGRRRVSWSIDYVVVPGDPFLEKTWEGVTDVLNRRFHTETGIEMAISRFAVDTGYATHEVYTWARQQGWNRVMAVKGQEKGAVAVGQPHTVDIQRNGKRIARGARFWPVATGLLKGELYGCLRLDRPTDESGEEFPAGYCHFPKYDDEYFKQLTAEELKSAKTRTGYTRTEWQKIRERNEALDCRIYNRAAAALFGIDRFSEKSWRTLEAQCMNAAPVIEEAVPATMQPQPVQRVPSLPAGQPKPQPSATSGRGGWIGRRRGWLSR
jgi:phage terminase large subunit GpA-like protein